VRRLQRRKASGHRLLLDDEAARRRRRKHDPWQSPEAWAEPEHLRGARPGAVEQKNDQPPAREFRRLHAAGKNPRQRPGYNSIGKFAGSRISACTAACSSKPMPMCSSLSARQRCVSGRCRSADPCTPSDA